MKKAGMKKAAALLAVLLVLVAAWLLFSRPMTIRQWYPMLTPEQCTGIEAGYRVGVSGEGTTVFVARDSDDFERLWDLLLEQSYRRSLRDLLPQGTRTHLTQPGDFIWEVCFHFENVELPGGGIGSGGMLSVQYWYGELDIHFEDKRISCRTQDQTQWAQQILDVLP